MPIYNVINELYFFLFQGIPSDQITPLQLHFIIPGSHANGIPRKSLKYNEKLYEDDSLLIVYFPLLSVYAQKLFFTPRGIAERKKKEKEMEREMERENAAMIKCKYRKELSRSEQ